MKKRITTLMLVMAFVLSMCFDENTVMAATKKPVLNVTKTVLVLKDNPFVELQVANYKAKPKWSSSNKSIATVDTYGEVTAKKIGKCTIKCKDGKTVLKCAITVVKSPSRNTIKKNTSVSCELLENGLVKCTIKNKLPYAMEVSTSYNCYDSNGSKLAPIINEELEDYAIYSKLNTTIAGNSTNTYYTVPVKATAYIKKDDCVFKVYKTAYYILDNSCSDYKVINGDFTYYSEESIDYVYEIENKGNFTVSITSIRLTLYDENKKVYRTVSETQQTPDLGLGIRSGDTEAFKCYISEYFTYDELQKYKLEVKPYLAYIPDSILQ